MRGTRCRPPAVATMLEERLSAAGNDMQGGPKMQVVTGVMLAVLGLFVQENGKRYGIEPDLKSFPQATAKETLASVLKAVDAKRFDYLTAQLADPAFIDDRVQRLYAGRFADQVDDTRTRLDAPTLALLKRYLSDGAWQVGKDAATVILKDSGDRLVAFRLVGGRWFMENRNR